MSEHIFREEVHNQLLARLLADLGVVSYPETITRSAAGLRRMPDVLVEYRGLRTIIEGKVDDHPGAQEEAHRDAERRINDGLAHISLAVLYPPELRKAPSPEFLREMIDHAPLYLEVISECGSEGWTQCHVVDIGDILRRTFEQISQQDIVNTTAAKLGTAVDEFARITLGREAAVARFAEILGFGEPPLDLEGKRPRDYKLRWREGAAKIAGLTLLNAMIFQEILSDTEPSGRISPLRSALAAADPLTELSNAWAFIYQSIDYQPIFGVATGLINELATTPETVRVIRFLGEKATETLAHRASLKHDLMGRVYHTLLADKKYLGTYYTSVPAATMLLKAALSPKRGDLDWSDIEQIGRFRIADLACGTGTLLMAAYEAFTDNYVHACHAAGIEPDLNRLHQIIMERVLYGYDVLPSALHLTASTLALRSSSVNFGRMNLFTLPLGGKAGRLGSIEFLHGDQMRMNVDIFESAEQITPSGDEKVNNTHPIAPLPKLDLCVINPPFTRSVGGNLLFGSSPDQERRMMQDKLARLLRDKNIPANSTAGLGAIFVAVADRAIKTGGRLALVLPKTLLSGVAWEKTRRLLADKYVVETIIVSHDPARWNFSESTDLSEVLIVARKVGNGNGVPSGERVKCVNLWKNPVTSFTSLITAREIIVNDGSDIETGLGADYIEFGSIDRGQMLSIPWEELKNELWMLPCAFAQYNFVRMAYFLQKGVLYLEEAPKRYSIPITTLRKLGELGPDRRGIHTAFSVSNKKSPYPAYWGHDASNCIRLKQSINAFLKVKPAKDKISKYPEPSNLAPHAGRIMLAERLRMNTQSICSFILDKDALSNVWWPIKTTSLNDLQIKSLVIWLNSTLGIVVLLTRRGETQGAWVDFKKGNLEFLPVLDITALTESQLNILSDAFDEISTEPLLPFPQMEHDPVRAKIDAALSEALGLPDLSVYRGLLAQEPVISMKSLS